MKAKLIPKLFVAAAVVALVLQAADLRADAPTGHYTTVNATILDTKTGLTWQRTTTGSMTYTWDAANSFCSGLGSGWRLPTAKELLTLVDVHALGGAKTTALIDTATFPATSADINWWSSTTCSTASSEAWSLDFTFGELTGSDKTTELYARCVK